MTAQPEAQTSHERPDLRLVMDYQATVLLSRSTPHQEGDFSVLSTALATQENPRDIATHWKLTRYRPNGLDTYTTSLMMDSSFLNGHSLGYVWTPGSNPIEAETLGSDLLRASEPSDTNAQKVSDILARSLPYDPTKHIVTRRHHQDRVTLITPTRKVLRVIGLSADSKTTKHR